MKIDPFIPELLQHYIFSQSDADAIQHYFADQTINVFSFPTDALVYSSSSATPKIGFVLNGRVLVQTGSGSDQTILNTIGQGKMFGIANLYAEGEPFPTVITAAEPCRILFLQKEAFCDFIEHDPHALRNFLSFQSKKIMYLNRKIITFTAGSAEKKLTVFILDHEVNGMFTPPCSMSTLGNMLGISRASLYRAIDQLITLGLIEKKDKSFWIPDLKALSNFL